ncbi:MCE family protein [Nocardioides halotolerans]|uniref:MCE family protein n=1 Tax=Nocardioides halotolerans TaxID=433660 RepID=UPI0004258E6F|nr:MCE family protein [Nocardioides halotolerans]
MTGLRTTAAKFAAFALASVLLLVVLLNTMSHGLVGDTRDYDAEFSDVSGLRVGDDVRVAGVRVGRVESIDVTEQGARVGFALEEDQALLDTTRMVMRYQNLLGQRYLALVQSGPRGDELRAGATVPLGRTDPGFDLTELLNGFRPLFEVLQPSEVNQLASSLVQVLQGEGGTVEQLLQQTTQLTTYVADRDAVIGEVLQNLTPVLEHLQGRGTEIESTVLELRRLMDGLARDRKAIGASIDGVARLVGSTSSLLDDARAPLVRATRRFVEVADLLARTKGRLNRALESFGGTIGALGRLTSYENAMNVFLCSMTFAVGDAEDEINPAGSTDKHSAVCR